MFRSRFRALSKTMFQPSITKEWLLATMELEGDGFVNAGGVREKYAEGDSTPMNHSAPVLAERDVKQNVEFSLSFAALPRAEARSD